MCALCFNVFPLIRPKNRPSNRLDQLPPVRRPDKVQWCRICWPEQKSPLKLRRRTLANFIICSQRHDLYTFQVDHSRTSVAKRRIGEIAVIDSKVSSPVGLAEDRRLHCLFHVMQSCDNWAISQFDFYRSARAVAIT